MRFGESDRNPLALQTNLLYEGRWGDHPETYRLVGLPQGTPTDPSQHKCFQRGWRYSHRSSIKIAETSFVHSKLINNKLWIQQVSCAQNLGQTCRTVHNTVRCTPNETNAHGVVQHQRQRQPINKRTLYMIHCSN
jgi:hypothetical protein